MIFRGGGAWNHKTPYSDGGTGLEDYPLGIAG